MFDLSVFKRAGSKRVREAEDIVGDVTQNMELFTRLAKEGKLPKIAGGAQAYVVTTANTAAFAATPGTVLLPALIPEEQAPLVLALAIVNPVTFTAAANAVQFAYNSGAIIAPGSAATSSTVYPGQGTYATTTATTYATAVAGAVPFAGLNVPNYVVGIGGAAAAANNQSFFAIFTLA